MKLISIAFFCLFINSTAQAWFGNNSNFTIIPEIQTILNNASIEKEQLSPDRKSKATLYKSNNRLEEGEMADEVLKISSLDGTVWLYEGYGLMFDEFKFIGNNHLIMTMCSITTCGSMTFNIKTNGTVHLGGGKYTLIDSEQIKLSGAKLYDDSGAFWINKIVDYDGNLIEVLSSDNKNWKCIPLKHILSNQVEKEHPKLKQNANDCVYVDR